MGGVDPSSVGAKPKRLGGLDPVRVRLGQRSEWVLAAHAKFLQRWFRSTMPGGVYSVYWDLARAQAAQARRRRKWMPTAEAEDMSRSSEGTPRPEASATSIAELVSTFMDLGDVSSWPTSSPSASVDAQAAEGALGSEAEGESPWVWNALSELDSEKGEQAGASPAPVTPEEVVTFWRDALRETLDCTRTIRVR